MKRKCILLAILLISVLAVCEEPTVQLARVRRLSAAELADIRERANHGDSDAQLILGLAYDGANKTIKPDVAEARRWYEMSASHGNVDAQFWLVGLDYEQGQKPPAIRSRYLELAKRGHVGAMSLYASMCADGAGGPKDFSSAMSWWKKAAELGSREGAFNVGIMYLDGEGVPIDKKIAVEWLKRAAESGSVEAASRLGPMALLSEGGLQPGPDATRWLKTAAEAGDSLAMFDLGMVLFHGLGTDPDYAEAYKWFTLASERGQVDGRKGMLPKMTNEQVAKAEKLADAWNAEHKD